MRPGRAAAAALLAAVLAGCTLVARVTWRPQPLVMALEPNAYRVRAVTLHTRDAIASLDLVPSPPLQPFVSVIPSTAVNLAAGADRTIRLVVSLPATVRPGTRITGRLDAGGSGGPAPGALQITIAIGPSTPEATLASLQAALENGDLSSYVAQFAPARRLQERRTFLGLTDAARLALAQTVHTAERTALSDDGATAEYKVYVLLGTQRFESSILLQRSPADGIWRVARF